ncbi:TPA: S-methyl-5'-thioadenosine phosphorylase [Candidatus Poribacteria bacterium]|nr:S-methyl-5'-thioadenosine phosphorylase [Candidatus Poribacteria bacterium]HEX29309.1 S-methyl-5'-thioadenosine phosphorylase [Candidatus Poribacteria bacterium]
MKVKIGVIGGSGFYEMEGLTDIEEIDLDTPFGKPSDRIVIGTLEGKKVAFLPRHGRGHRILPSELNVRANIYALKSLGVEWLISVSAVGSLREEIKPRDFVVPDQIFDNTKGRKSTFFGEGMAVHVAMSDPFCPVLRGILVQSAKEHGVTVHDGGTYICIEGPQFSTRAESEVYRKLGFDVIGMTAIPEAKLAREAEMCYATLACVTDYDCWHPEHEEVTAEMILSNLLANVEHAKTVVKRAVALIPEERTGCDCSRALEKAIATRPDAIPYETKRKLSLLIGKYIKRSNFL